jgi:hypothetical protein
LLVVTVASSVAPGHPIFNPPALKFLVGAMTVTAAMFAWEAARWVPKAEPRDLNFVVSFDDYAISLAYPDGTTDSAPWDDLEMIAIQPHEDHLFWTGPYFVCLTSRSRGPLLIPAFSVGLRAFLERLCALPGIDRDRIEALMRGDTPSRSVLWPRENGL